jgi:hypothetical protein
MKMKGIPAVAVKSKKNPDIPEFYRPYNLWGAIFYSMNQASLPCQEQYLSGLQAAQTLCSAGRESLTFFFWA